MDALLFYMERIFIMTGIPMRCFDADGVNVLFRRGYRQELDPVKSIKRPLLEMLKQSSLPFLDFEGGVFVYGAIKENDGRIVLLGPISNMIPDKEQVRLYAKEHDVPEEDFFIATKPYIAVSAALTMIYSSLTGKEISEQDVPVYGAGIVNFSVDENEYESYVMESTDIELDRLSYTDEKKFIQNIFRMFDDGYTGQDPRISLSRVGKVARNPFKQMEYLMCSSIAIISRAAIDEGLDAARAYAVSDLYLQRLEMCRSESDMLKVSREMQRTFAELVKKAKEVRSKSSYVEKCKVFIANHLNKTFALDDLANEIGINKSYLSRKFTEEMGVGIKQYTLMKRIEAATNMLKYSDTDLPKIADYFCFTSQSHFGQVFKQVTGITPQAYRNRERLMDIKEM